MAHLFTYGSLMFDDVWKQLVKGNYTASRAILQGYARRCVKNEEYPVVFEANEQVLGTLYHDISAEDMAILDGFEGEYYARQSVYVILNDVPLLAETYVLKEKYYEIIDDRLWSEEDFLRHGMKRFIETYKGFF